MRVFFCDSTKGTSEVTQKAQFIFKVVQVEKCLEQILIFLEQIGYFRYLHGAYCPPRRSAPRARRYAPCKYPFDPRKSRFAPSIFNQGLNFSAVPRNSAVFPIFFIPDFFIILEISVNLLRKKIIGGGGVSSPHRHVIYRWKALDLTRLEKLFNQK